MKYNLVERFEREWKNGVTARVLLEKLNSTSGISVQSLETVVEEHTMLPEKKIDTKVELAYTEISRKLADCDRLLQQKTYEAAAKSFDEAYALAADQGFSPKTFQKIAYELSKHFESRNDVATAVRYRKINIAISKKWRARLQDTRDSNISFVNRCIAYSSERLGELLENSDTEGALSAYEEAAEAYKKTEYDCISQSDKNKRLSETYAKKGRIYFRLDSFESAINEFISAKEFNSGRKDIEPVMLRVKHLAEQVEKEYQTRKQIEFVERSIEYRTIQIHAFEQMEKSPEMCKECGFAYLKRGNSYYAAQNKKACVDDWKKSVQLFEESGKELSNLIADICAQIFDLSDEKEKETFATKAAGIYNRIYARLNDGEITNHYNCLSYLVDEKHKKEYKKMLDIVKKIMTQPKRR